MVVHVCIFRTAETLDGVAEGRLSLRLEILAMSDSRPGLSPQLFDTHTWQQTEVNETFLLHEK